MKPDWDDYDYGYSNGIIYGKLEILDKISIMLQQTYDTEQFLTNLQKYIRTEKANIETSINNR